MEVHKKTRAKVAIALKFQAVVLAVLSLDLLVQVTLPTLSPSEYSNPLHFHFQLRWGIPGGFEIKNNVIEHFDNFVKTACEWVKIKIFSQSSQSGAGFGKGKVSSGEYATKIIREWNEVFCGFGAYSVQEVFFQAGLFIAVP
jgi:hypothetical protein